MLAKIGPRQELERTLPGHRIVLDDFGAGDVGRHQVGRELDALEGQVERLGERAHHERLGQAGHADQQAVAAAEDRHQQLVEDLILADDDLAYLGTQFLVRGAQVLHGLHVRVGASLKGGNL